MKTIHTVVAEINVIGHPVRIVEKAYYNDVEEPSSPQLPGPGSPPQHSSSIFAVEIQAVDSMGGQCWVPVEFGEMITDRGDRPPLISRDTLLNALYYHIAGRKSPFAGNR